MIPEPRPNCPRVLLVGPRSTIARLEPATDSGIAIELSSDVYRALAKLLCEPNDAHVCVVVALECVGPHELAFFSIAARLRRGLKVLVHADAGGESKIAKALEAGATGVWSADSWRDFAPRLEAPVSVEVPVEPKAPMVEPARVEPVVELPPPEDEEEPLVEEETEEAPPTPRVPWLRYADGPQRAAPPMRTPPTPIAPPQTPTTPPPSARDYEPLLTDEELEALMSDDISAIAPKPNPSWRRAERPEGGRP